MRVCLCVWQRAAKQDCCARLLLAETLWGTGRVVDAEERRAMKEWLQWLRVVLHLLLPGVLSQVHLAGPTYRGGNTSAEESGAGEEEEEEEEEEKRKHPAGIIVLKDYEGQAEDLSSLVSCCILLFLCFHITGAQHLTGEGTVSLYLRGPATLLPKWHLVRSLPGIITGQIICNI